ncbi:MAG TPA: hypothetical protein VIG33_07160 [Pseudobdellovibrionaceae bacterium]|jgi:hypothetical protein
MKRRSATHKLTLILVSAVFLAIGCNKSADSFSLLADASSYKQNAQYIPRKVDILWVIDNSGSMDNSQTRLANSFSAFISKFMTTDSDFHMAVTTSDAFLAPYDAQYANFSRIRDGVGSVHSGVFVMDKNTPDMESVFLKNIKQGIKGSGDERAFSSFKATLSDPWNASFRRPDAFLAIIIVSDEDDFSHNDSTNGLKSYYFSENYNDAKMYSVQSYVDDLTNYTANAGAGKNFSVNTISILDSVCLAQLKDSAQKIGQRYIALADATGGQKISLCSDFSQSLQVLSESIVELSSVFQLTREPLPETISVVVDGTEVPQNATNGWTYDATTISIAFHGTAIPTAGADVRINFDPKGVKN